MYNIEKNQIFNVEMLLINRRYDSDYFYLCDHKKKFVNRWYDKIFYDCNLYVEKNTIKVVGKECNTIYTSNEGLYRMYDENDDVIINDPEFPKELNYDIKYSKRFWIFGEKLKYILYKKNYLYVNKVDEDIKTFIYTNKYFVKISNIKLD